METQSTATGTGFRKTFLAWKAGRNKNGYTYWFKDGKKENMSEFRSTVLFLVGSKIISKYKGMRKKLDGRKVFE